MKYKLNDLQGTNWFGDEIFTNLDVIKMCLITRLDDSGELPENWKELTLDELLEICGFELVKESEETNAKN